jgi:hypothetical protein
MKKSIFTSLILSIFVYSSSFAQFNETIVSDRPGQSNSPNTVGKMVLQFQTGPQFDGGRRDNYKSNIFWWPAVIRFGIAERIDVISNLSYQSGKQEIFDFELEDSGISSADFGLRFNVFEENEKAPALGFEAYYKTKWISDDYRPDRASARLNLMASKTITDMFSITSNLGVDFNGDGGPSEGFYTINLVLGVNDELGVFFENYGYFSGDYFDSYFDFGAGYLLSPDLQLDITGGFGYNNDTFSFMVSGGISYRITKWRKNEEN